ncbi:alpha/beta hydrolase [soil metagenome]
MSPVRLHIETIGRGNPVLLIPGLGYASWCWREQTPLGDHWMVTKVDPRGAGRSPKPTGPYSIGEMADDIAGSVEAREPFHVVGHSLGGYLAMTLAIERPEMVRSLILIATSAGGANHHPVPEATREAWMREVGKSPAEYARATMHLSFSPGWAEANPDEYEKWLGARLEHPTPPEAWNAQYAAGASHLERGLEVERIAVPIMIIHGKADRILPFENGVELAERIPPSRLFLIEGLGHLVQMERPDMFNSLAAGFWWGIESRPGLGYRLREP